jgi:hypothetical protein
VQLPDTLAGPLLLRTWLSYCSEPRFAGDRFRAEKIDRPTGASKMRGNPMDGRCPVCLGSVQEDQDRAADKMRLRCPRCGPFEISGTALAMLQSRVGKDPLVRARLSHAIRSRTSEPSLMRAAPPPIVALFPSQRCLLRSSIPSKISCSASSC